MTDLWKFALLVYQSDDVELFRSQQVQDILIILELDVFPFNALLVVLCLLQLEDVMNEELLQTLVAEIDAELLKTVSLKSFKTEYVQNSN